MIKSKDISVVVQGAIDKINTPICLRSIRKVLPYARIILSTWEYSDTQGLDYDELIFNKDPGNFPCDEIENSIPNNINRQIVSTKSALKNVNTKYCLKMRTDFVLTSDNFLKYFSKNIKREKKYSYLKKPVLVCNEYSRNPRYTFNEFRMCYCVSDFFYFGLSEDIKEIFNLELVSGDEEQKYFQIYKEKRHQRLAKEALCRYMPEQYIWLGFVKKHLKEYYCEHRDDCNKQAIFTSEKTIANNCIILNKKNLGIYSLKENLFTKGKPENCYNEFDWTLINLNNIFSKTLYKLRILNANLNKGKNLKQKQNYKRVHFLNQIDVQNIKQEYISFDIFDTLLFRKIHPAELVVDRSATYIDMLLGTNCKERYIALRDSYRETCAISSQYQKQDFEYLINDCYMQIFNDKKLADNIVENELLRELDVLYVNPSALKLLRDLKKNNKKLIAISDMFFSEKDIKRILEHFNLLKYFDKVYVSSEIKYMKWTGKLFKYVLNDLNISPDMLLHLGDNKISDTINPSQYGINAIFYKNKKNLKRKKNLEKAYFQDKKRFVGEIFKFNRKDKSFEGFIKNYFAPDFINFVYSIMIDSYQNKIDKICFLERDGNIFFDIWQKLFNQITLFKNLAPKEIKLLKFSRKDTACLINLEDPINTIKRANKVNPPPVFSITHIIGCFGLSLSNFSNSKQILIKNNDTNIDFYINNYKTIFQPELNKRKKIVEGFIKKELNSKNIALCDVGWGGTSQKDLLEYIKDNHLDINLKGYYYAADDRIKEIKNDVFYYQYACNLLFGYSLIEFLIKAYTPDSNDIMQETYELNKISRKIIIDYCEIFSKLVNEKLLLPSDVEIYTKPLISIFIKNPPYDFVKLIKNVRYSLDRRLDDEYILLCPRLKKKKDKYKLYSTAQYINGSLVLCGFKNIVCKKLLTKNILKLLPHFLVAGKINCIQKEIYKDDDN